MRSNELRKESIVKYAVCVKKKEAILFMLKRDKVENYNFKN